MQTATALAPQLHVGDLVFIRIPYPPFRQIAAHTGTWTNHVGIVVTAQDGCVEVAESRLPRSSVTPWARFVARSAGGRVLVARLRDEPLAQQSEAIVEAAARRLGITYDTGFDIASPRQFCSRFVHEVLQEATGATVGSVQRFDELLAEQPGASLAFWRLWYLGRIPWQRRTVTPASLLRSPLLRPVFDGALR